MVLSESLGQARGRRMNGSYQYGKFPDDTFASQPRDSALRGCINGCTGSQTMEVIVGGMEPGLS